MVKSSAVLSISLLFGALGPALAGQAKTRPGDASAGRSYANASCAGCHGIEPGAARSINPKAPPFPTIAKSHRLTLAQIEGWLVSSHKNMPAVIVPSEKRADLIAYIKSLALATLDE